MVDGTGAGSTCVDLERLVNDLNELSMSDIGALTYRKVEVDPLSNLDDIIGLYEKRFADKGIEIKRIIPENITLKILVDPDRIQQLCFNLLSKSLKYTNAPGKLVVSASSKGGKLIVTFVDSSPGVDKEYLLKLFDRLFRDDNLAQPYRKRCRARSFYF